MTRNSLIPAAELRRLSQRLVALQGRLDLVEKSQRATQLSNSSLEGGYITIRDADGLPRGYVGMQPDGNSGVRVVNNPAPSRPNTPELTAIMAGVGITWNGELFDGPPTPGNFSHINVYLSGAGEDFIHGPANLIGALPRAGTIPVTPLPSTPYWARFVAYNNDDPVDASEPSFTAGPITPSQVVAQELLDGIVTEVKLAADAVTEAKLAAGAVTETKVADDAISTPKLVAGAVQAEKIAAGAVQTDHLVAGAVTTEKIEALAVTADHIAANAIEAGHVQAGAVTAEKLAANLVIAGDPNGDRVVINAANGIEQYLDGERTLSIPPDGSPHFAGTVTAGDGIGIGPTVVVDPDQPAIDMYPTTTAERYTLLANVGPRPNGATGPGLQVSAVNGSGQPDGFSINAWSTNAWIGQKATNGAWQGGIVKIQRTGQIYVGVEGGGELSVNNDNVTLACDNQLIIAAGDASIRMFGASDGLEIVGDVTINGFDFKPFIIDHPTDPDRWLIHACAEGPTADLLYRGYAEIVDGCATVELPSYFEAAARGEGRQVQVTPVDELCMVSASRIEDGRFTIKCSGPDGTIVQWLATAIRADVELFDAEPLRADVQVFGDGPYRYFAPKLA